MRARLNIATHAAQLASLRTISRNIRAVKSPKSPAPALATVKRLFAVSGNRCAFPKCPEPLVHHGKVTGRLCHIKASSRGGPRYDPAQTDEQRNGFDNLILMCPIHHDVIDADPTAYTVERLAQLKSEQEVPRTPGASIDDEVAGAFLVSDARVEGGSIIVSQNQSGGQIAHEIRNYGPPRRIITQAMRSRVVDVLRGTAPSRIGFASTQGDTEAHDFKQQLMDVFREAGWQVEDMETFMFFGTKKGLILTIPFAASGQGLPQVVAHALAQTGSPVAGNHGDVANECGLYVQVWHAP